MLPLTTFYRSGAHRSDVYKWDAFVTSWRFYNRAWQPQRHNRLPETSGTLWIHQGALTNQRCSLTTGCGINHLIENQRCPDVEFVVAVGNGDCRYDNLRSTSVNKVDITTTRGVLRRNVVILQHGGFFSNTRNRHPHIRANYGVSFVRSKSDVCPNIVVSSVYNIML